MSNGQLRAGNFRLALKEFDRVFVIAVGKAAVPMGAAASQVLGRALAGGIAVTKHGHARRILRKIAVLEAGHPIPDESGLIASEKVGTLLKDLNARDLLIVLVSGGASGVLPAPAEPITLSAKQQTTDLLLRAGADITELNAVRKHLSLLKGGKLAALAYPATVVSLLLSDVIGDPLETIGSGPTAPDPTTFSDALAVLDKYRVRNRVPKAVRSWLQDGAAGKVLETPKPGNPIFQNVHNVVVGGNRLALEAAAQKSRALGYHTLILSSTMHGETREVARVHAQVLCEVRRSGHPIRPPACILSGGETTVTVHGHGKGGRNQEFALAAAIEIDGLRDSLIASLGTDGTDGPTDAAGAIVTGQTITRAFALGLDAAAHLRENDSYPFFDDLGDLIRTGPTGTNVMDIHLMLARS